MNAPLHAARALADAATERLRVFAQPQRLMILSFLLGGERTVGEIEAATGIGQPALSQQLAELRRAELVRTRRAAKQVHYRLAGEAVAHRMRSIEAMFGNAGQDAAATIDPVTPPRRPRTARPNAAAAFATVG